MKIFEFLFNPKAEKYRTFETFCYEPEGAREKPLGHLYMAGELSNILPPNAKLLQNLAENIKNAYYNSSAKNPEIAAQYALQSANKFLESLSKKGNVSWLGNLHFATISIVGDELYLSKTGDIKILIERNGELLDIGEGLEKQNITPPNFFSRFVAGKILLQDKVLILTKELFQIFEAISLLSKFPEIPIGKEYKKVKDFLRPYEKQLKDYSGLLFVLGIDKIEPTVLRTKCILLPNLIKLLPKIHLPAISVPATKAPRIQIPTLSVPKMGTLFTRELQKRILPLIALILIVTIGFIFAKIQERREINIAEQKLLEVQQKIWQAQSYSILKKEKEANKLLQKVLEELKDLENTPLKDRAQKAREDTIKQLTQLNKIEIIEDPIMLFLVPDFSPELLLQLSDTLYLASPNQAQLFMWNLTEKELIKTEITWPFSLFSGLQNFLAFYQKEKNVLVVQDGKEVSLFKPYTIFNPTDMSSFGSGLYFLDAQNGQIVKYKFLENQETLIPTVWISQVYGDAKLKTAISLAVDGSIWVLAANGAIHRYWGGSWQETLDISIWPKLSQPKKIFTTSLLPYLYILDSPENRIVILDKQGKIIKQYKSGKFNNLKDFTVSADGKMIYLLNGESVWQIAAEL